MQTKALETFFRQATNCWRDDRFESREIEYKIRLGSELKGVFNTLKNDPKSFLDGLRRVLASKDDNLISWRDRDPFFKWSDRNRTLAFTAFKRFVAAEADIPAKFAALESILDQAELTTPGQQLIFISTMLMAVDPLSYPPIRTQPFENAFAATGYPSFHPSNVLMRYQHAIAFLDELIVYSPKYGMALRHRLDAQSVVWCCYDEEEEPSQSLSKTNRNEIITTSFYEAQELAQDEENPISQTDYPTTINARRGQDQFRHGLLFRWDSQCSVTECKNVEMLRASHLKPWRDATDQERLNLDNGLLLTPNLDAALDQGLITFRSDGSIRISPQLSKEDCRVLGLNGLRLRRVDSKLKSFLEYHEQHIFKKDIL